MIRVERWLRRLEGKRKISLVKRVVSDSTWVAHCLGSQTSGHLLIAPLAMVLTLRRVENAVNSRQYGLM